MAGQEQSSLSHPHSPPAKPQKPDQRPGSLFCKHATPLSRQGSKAWDMMLRKQQGRTQKPAIPRLPRWQEG